MIRSLKTQKTFIDALTGQVKIYNQCYANVIYDHQTPVSLIQARDDLNAGFAANGVDAFCDGVLQWQMAVTDTLQPSIWAVGASPIPIAVAAGILLVVKLVIALLIVIAVYYLLTALVELLYGQPKTYYLEDGTIASWEEYISYQNAHYWYVCSKDGSGWGDKTKYLSITDVPQAEVDAYKDHCASAPDIGDKGANIIAQLTTLAIIVGVVIVVANVAPSLISAFSRRATR